MRTEQDVKIMITQNEEMIKYNRKNLIANIDSMVTNLERLRKDASEGRNISIEEMKCLWGQQSAVDKIEQIKKLEYLNEVLRAVIGGK